MIVIDYGGRAPDPDAPNGGAVQSWDTASLTHHDYLTGQSRPFTADERIRFAAQIADDERTATLAAISAGVADLQDALQVAAADITAATARAADAAAVQSAASAKATAVTSWEPSAAAATDLASLRAAVVADLRAVRAEVAGLHQRDALLAGALVELYTARALLARGVKLAFEDLIGLATIYTRDVMGAD